MSDKSQGIRILFAEDLPEDVELAQREINSGDIEFTSKVVDTEDEFLKALNDFRPDIVISDYAMPTFDGMQALEITRKSETHIPFIILTGSMNEETAVECMKAGADDYVIKEQIARLPFAIKEVLSKVRTKTEKEWLQHFLLKISQLSVKEIGLKAYFQAIHQEIKKIMKADNFYIALYDHKTKKYALPYHFDEYDDLDSENPISLENTLTDYPRKTAKAQLVTKEYERELKEKGLIQPIGTPSLIWMGAPIINTSSDWVSGVIVIQDYKDKDAYDKNDLKLLEVIASEIGVFIDRKREQEKFELISRSVEQSPVSIIITDAHGDIEYTNPAFTHITGYAFEEVKGGNPRILKSGDHSKDFYKNLWDTILAGKDWQGEFHNLKKNGDFYWEQAVISPVIDEKGGITHFVAVKEDVTEKKQAFEELIKAKEKAEESDRLKTAFLANMSHEIRTPMNGILGFTDILRNSDLSSEEKDDYIEIIHRGGQRLMNTVNDIIEISKIEAGVITTEWHETDLNHSLEDVIKFFRPEAKEKGLEIHLDQLLTENEATILTDKSKFEAILTNLFKNAIKYTNEGHINVGVDIKNDWVEFYVKDTGIGVPKNRQEAIFNRFEQADISDTKAFQGSGLGLAISKSYAEMLGGKIWLESEENKGSVFYFSLPFRKMKEPNKKVIENEETFSSPQPGVSDSDKKLKVLVAEDDKNSFVLLTTIFRKYNWNIIHTETGRQTIEKYREQPDIDLILMDIKLPDIDGYEATRQLKAINPKVPIIAQTAYAMKGDRQKALEAGCDEYISKPIKKATLLQMIQKVMGS